MQYTLSKTIKLATSVVKEAKAVEVVLKGKTQRSRFRIKGIVRIEGDRLARKRGAGFGFRVGNYNIGVGYFRKQKKQARRKAR